MAYEAALDDTEFQTLQLNIDQNKNQILDLPPTRSQKLRGFEVSLLVINRCVGSGIFYTGATQILRGAGSPGAALFLWALGAFVSACGLLVWLEWGLTIPLRLVPGSSEVRSVPRSGGEKNYLEWAFSKWKSLTTCSYGISFILLGNLSANALAFGEYVMNAAGHDDPTKKTVIPIAIGALTVAILVHVFSRRGGIILNDAFGVFKIFLLLAIFILGIVYRKDEAASQFHIDDAFKSREPLSFPSYVYSFIYVLYSFAGFQQPFYVLSEAQSPRTTFPRATLSSMACVSVLYMMANIGYLLVVPRGGLHGWESSGKGMGQLFVESVFPGNSNIKTLLYALIATSVYGNILVMTFTAARVKQEIAKEGILPYSLFFAQARTTLVEFFAVRFQRKPRVSAAQSVDSHLEQSPMAALLLHWTSSIFLIGVTSKLTPGEAYNLLAMLYTFVIVFGVGFFVSLGLLWMKYRPLWMSDGLAWKAIHRKYNPWLDPFHAVIYGGTCGFLVIAALIPPSKSSDFYYLKGHIKWFVVPTIALTAPIWGIAWFAILKLREWWTQKILVTERVAFIKQDEKDESQWIQKAELVDLSRQVKGTAWSRKQGLDEEEPFGPERVTVIS